MLMLKRHMILKQAVDDYADSIQKLADRAQKMFAEDHPDGCVLFFKFDVHTEKTMSELTAKMPIPSCRSTQVWYRLIRETSM